MRVASGMDPQLGPRQSAERAVLLESLGYDSVHLAETVHDPMVAAVLAGESTSKITIRTAVVVAFARSPMLLAYQALDVQRAAKGRFELGIGTQIRQVIEGRYSMHWSQPVERMRETLLSIRALLRAFVDGEHASFEGEIVRIDRVPPYFNPGPIDGLTPPPILLGAVRPRMLQLASEHADGLITHPTNSDAAYLADELHTALVDAAAPPAFAVVASPNVVTGPDHASIAEERARQRQLLGFLLTTPAYGGVLERFGDPELGLRLRTHLRQHGEGGLGELVPDEIADQIAPCAPYDEIAGLLAERYEGRCDELVLSLPKYTGDATRLRDLLAEIRSIPGRPRDRADDAQGGRR